MNGQATRTDTMSTSRSDAATLSNNNGEDGGDRVNEKDQKPPAMNATQDGPRAPSPDQASVHCYVDNISISEFLAQTEARPRPKDSDLESNAPPLRARVDKERKTMHEDYPLGYPRLARFLSQKDANFGMFRRFSYLRTRVLLNMQDQLCEMQEELKELEATDEEINLATRRHDPIEKRGALLEAIEKRLHEYDSMLRETQRLSTVPAVQHRDFRSVVNWVEGFEPVNREELGFLDDIDDLVYTTPEEAPALEELCLKIAEFLGSLKFEFMRKIFFPRQYSTNKNIIIVSSTRVQALAKVVTTIVASQCLVVPMIVLYFVKNVTAKLLITCGFTVTFSILIMLSSSKVNNEVFILTSAYAAVLVVFLGNVL